MLQTRYANGTSPAVIMAMANKRRQRGKFNKAASEALERQSEVLDEQSQALRFEFIVAELDLAITFYESATSTGDPARSRRSIAKAEEAHSSAGHFPENERIDEPIRKTVQTKISKLEPLLLGLSREKSSSGKSQRNRT